MNNRTRLAGKTCTDIHVKLVSWENSYRYPHIIIFLWLKLSEQRTLSYLPHIFEKLAFSVPPYVFIIKGSTALKSPNMSTLLLIHCGTLNTYRNYRNRGMVTIRDGNFSSLVWPSSLVLIPLLELVPVLLFISLGMNIDVCVGPFNYSIPLSISLIRNQLIAWYWL